MPRRKSISRIKYKDTKVFQMHLCHDNFLKISNGTKTIEMRLNDRKRSGISAGNVIVFTDSVYGNQIKCTVSNVFKYDTFEELYKNHSKESIGYSYDEEANPEDMLKYYKKSEIEKYGVIGI